MLCMNWPMQAGKQAIADNDTKRGRYDIECAGNGAQGTYMVKVWSYSKKKDIAESQCRKNAVHGVLFKGFGGPQGCIGQKAMLAAGAEEQHKVYFDSFFASDGEFAKYASIVGGTYEEVKIGKQYKVGVVVCVRKDDLRKAMEAAGILKGLNAGF